MLRESGKSRSGSATVIVTKLQEVTAFKREDAGLGRTRARRPTRRHALEFLCACAESAAFEGECWAWRSPFYFYYEGMVTTNSSKMEVIS